MLLSLNWLKDFVEIPKGVGPKELGDKITLHTAEVEGFEETGSNLDNIVVGKVVELKKHPNADKLKIAMTDIGEDEPIQLVCGGVNLEDGMTVAVAKIGAMVKWHGEGDLIEMKKAKIRGESSSGMICASNEIGLGAMFPHEDMGILDFDSFGVEAKPGTPVKKIIPKDIVFEIDNKSLTHRPDLWGHEGMAREVSAIFGSKKLQPKNFLFDGKAKESPVTATIKDKSDCRRFCVAVMDGVTVGPSPDWLKNKLEAVGQKSINNIVDITNYVMLEIGQPMHAFDHSEIDGNITVRRAKNGEKLIRLDEEEDTLDDSMLVVADDKKPLAIAGIKGGLHSGIHDSTTKIVLESANFDPTLVRKTSQKIGLRTDALQRFEKSLDPANAERGMRRAIQLIQEICEGATLEGLSVGSWKAPNLNVTITPEEICSKIGTDIPKKEIVSILTSLEFNVEDKKETLHIDIPSFRSTKDVDMKDDIVEEIARMHGYENIPAILPELPIKLPQENYEHLRINNAKNILATGLGMDELYTYSFYGVSEIEKCKLHDLKHATIINYLSEEQTHMRARMFPNILKAAQHNLKYFEEANLFEVGRIYAPEKGKLPVETTMACGVFVREKASADTFLTAKGTFISFMRKFAPGVGFELQETDNHAAYCGPHVLSIIVEGEIIGHIFDLHPSVKEAYKLPDVVCFEFNIGMIAAMPDDPIPYQALPKFPSAIFDVSVVVDEKVRAAEIIEAIAKAEQKLITDIDIFDIYRNEQHVGQDKKAVACNITLQSPDRTLEEKEVKKIQDNVFANLQKIGGKIRGL